jgi:hypothetical protein
VNKSFSLPYSGALVPELTCSIKLNERV